MLVDESTCLDLHRKAFQKSVARDGIKLWKQHQEHARLKKLQDQNEVRDMLASYWPFGRVSDIQPRGLRNLRRDGLFPDKDFKEAKRFVGTLDLVGRHGGGGAPVVTDTGRRITRTRIDPLLRFQFGSDDLRRCVDNTIRYKTNRQQQEEYRKELDKLVEEKRQKETKNKLEAQVFEQKQIKRWSNEKTLKQIEIEEAKRRQDHNKLKHIEIIPPNRIRKIDPLFYPCRRVYVGPKNRIKLSPLSNGKDYGVELVPLLNKQRHYPLTFHLETTDVTNDKRANAASVTDRDRSGYVKGLNQQVLLKQQKSMEAKTMENEIVRRHFSTCDSYWGRPGHGAPTSAIKMQRLDRLLYPQMVAIGVH